MGGLQPEAPAQLQAEQQRGLLILAKAFLLPQPLSMPPSPGCPTPPSRSRGPTLRLLAPTRQQWAHQEGTSLTKHKWAKPPRGRECAGAHGHLGLLNGVAFHFTPAPVHQISNSLSNNNYLKKAGSKVLARELPSDRLDEKTLKPGLDPSVGGRRAPRSCWRV